MDLTGQTYGNFTVLEDTGERFHGSIIWRCRCSCGNECDVPSIYLRSGQKTSCKECSTRRKWERWERHELNGKIFGELTVLGPTTKYSGHAILWECQCSCGKKIKRTGWSLISGMSKSCGHTRSDSVYGRRRGRLVLERPIEKRRNGKVRFWVARCDCGNTRLLTLSDFNFRKSCGHCLIQHSNPPRVICPACGKDFVIKWNGEETPQFCPECREKYAGKNWRVCPICYNLFQAYPSDKTVTCSKECSKQWKSYIHTGISNTWSDEAREEKSKLGQTENLKKGVDAVKASPIAGRFETNKEAKIWILVSPSGEEIKVRNLNLWAREHTELFEKPPGDKSALQISAGFRAIAQTIAGNRGAPGKPRGTMFYKGWSLKGPPKEPDD